MFEKKGFWSLGEVPLGPNGLSVSGDRTLGNRSSSIRPLSGLEKAIMRVYITADC